MRKTNHGKQLNRGYAHFKPVTDNDLRGMGLLPELPRKPKEPEVEKDYQNMSLEELQNELEPRDEEKENNYFDYNV